MDWPSGMNFLRPIVIALVMLQSLTARSLALEWKSTELTVSTLPFQTEQVAVFEFTNHSSKPVNMLELETSCGCLLANSDLKIYAPGAPGKITAKFTIGDRSGLYERMITVITDESDSPVHLTLKVEVPELASLTPRSVAWQLHEEPAEKSVDLISAPSLAIVFSSAQSTNDAYTARLECIEKGRHYRLHIKPTTTDRPTSAAVRIFGREQSGHDVVLSAYANIH